MLYSTCGSPASEKTINAQGPKIRWGYVLTNRNIPTVIYLAFLDSSYCLRRRDLTGNKTLTVE